jgi:hypothetical protein
MALARINSLAATKTLHSNLQELPTYCSTIKGDLELLHSYFDTNSTQIITHGATVDDPISILCAAYMVVPCHNFRSYIKCKQDAYTDGTLTLTHKELILLATNKFNLLKQEGTWGAKSPDEDKIMAMQAKLTALKGQFQLVLNLKKAVGVKQGGGNDKKKRTRKTMPIRKSRRRMRIG